MSEDYQFQISVKTEYIEEQSEPENERYVFAYTVTIENTGELGAKLDSRHWVITDANGEVTEVQGQGVIGEQPFIEPGKSYQYSSGAVIATPIGTMEGDYSMIGQNGAEFKAPIPVFSLTTPGVLH
ncbi:Co2+/Mg2+ efflux protein ApaG [Kangiella sediminilitoris]|uniref:Protein ApaG n=1 Tax=Kangiella sediminilitoris TaxID=1144748 RepID=A0A1B3B807_9GAMM|nr:Co2+/Mg2+ efflux protein ApaG [Kangiella sediminilitoris]AOE48925.1 Protein ApaG [Kangiella sediminilitoris]